MSAQTAPQNATKAQSAKARHAVARVDEIPVGERKIVRVPAFGKEIEIGVFNVGGRYFAYRNVCPHAGAPVCVGRVCGTTLPGRVGEFILAREGEILRCPWHGWEFDLLTGQHLVDEKMRLRPYAVETGNREGESATSPETLPSVAASCDVDASENLESYPVEAHEDTLFILI